MRFATFTPLLCLCVSTALALPLLNTGSSNNARDISEGWKRAKNANFPADWKRQDLAARNDVSADWLEPGGADWKREADNTERADKYSVDWRREADNMERGEKYSVDWRREADNMERGEKYSVDWKREGTALS